MMRRLLRPGAELSMRSEPGKGGWTTSVTGSASIAIMAGEETTEMVTTTTDAEATAEIALTTTDHEDPGLVPRSLDVDLMTTEEDRHLQGKQTPTSHQQRAAHVATEVRDVTDIIVLLPLRAVTIVDTEIMSAESSIVETIRHTLADDHHHQDTAETSIVDLHQGANMESAIDHAQILQIVTIARWK